MSDYIFGVAQPRFDTTGIAAIKSKSGSYLLYSHSAVKNDPHAVSNAYRIPSNQSVAFTPHKGGRDGGQVISDWASDVYLLPAEYSANLHTKLKNIKHMQVIEIWILNGLHTSLAGPVDVLKTLNDGKSVAKKFKVIIDLMGTTEGNIREFISRNVQGVAPGEIDLHEFYQHNHLCLEDKWHHFCFHSTH
ncbi:hypothetical protein [Stenotrophomonas sp. AB1(2024)]|uniref:hypothetical protein n=1 Tax=Stenotrophomonas sp. AB1(2024) TaxID=3132215 RepID=UPI0030A319C8